MTLEEYEKVREEKRKALLALKTEERKVDDKEFASMQPLSNKKANQEIFIKLVKATGLLYLQVLKSSIESQLGVTWFSSVGVWQGS